MAEAKTAEIKPQLVVRLAISLVSHSFLVRYPFLVHVFVTCGLRTMYLTDLSPCLGSSVVCFSAGVLALLLLPVLAKNTYISENALMPDSVISSQDIAEANRLMKEITDSNSRSANSGIEIPRLIAEHMADLGAEVCYHKNHPQPNQFHPLPFLAGFDSVAVQKKF